MVLRKRSCIFLQSLVSMTQSLQVLELGTYLGYSTLHMLQALPTNGSIITIDIENYFTKFLNLLAVKYKNKIVFIKGRTDNILPALKSKEPFDLIFIDAGHEFQDVYQDVKGVLPYIKHGSLLVFHDALSNAFPGVKKVITILKILNILCLGQLYESIFLPTPKRRDAMDMRRKSMSGIAVLKINNQRLLRGISSLTEYLI